MLETRKKVGVANSLRQPESQENFAFTLNAMGAKGELKAD